MKYQIEISAGRVSRGAGTVVLKILKQPPLSMTIFELDFFLKYYGFRETSAKFDP